MVQAIVTITDEEGNVLDESQMYYESASQTKQVFQIMMGGFQRMNDLESYLAAKRNKNGGG